MYGLFNQTGRQYGGLISDFPLNNIEKQTVRDIDHVLDYYHSGTFFVRNDHLLVKLINTIGTPLSYPIDQYYETTLARALFCANTLQLTSSINYGRWFRGIFYPGCEELIIAYTDETIPSEQIKGWRDLQPVRVLESPVSNMSYLVPDGRIVQSERGLVVIGVDLGQLMIQYRGFMENEALKKLEGRDDLLTTTHFVGKYVLPNMIKSQTDIALFNRLYGLEMGAPMGKATSKHPFYVTDYTQQTDKLLDIYRQRLSHAKREYLNYLVQIPKIFNDYPYNMPDIATTRQVWWVMFLAKKRMMEFLIQIGGREGIDFNRMWINKLKIDIKAFNSDGIFNKVLPEPYRTDMQQFFRTIEKL